MVLLKLNILQFITNNRYIRNIYHIDEVLRFPCVSDYNTLELFELSKLMFDCYTVSTVNFIFFRHSLNVTS